MKLNALHSRGWLLDYDYPRAIRASNGVSPLGGVKKEWGVKIQRFSSFKR